jgi:hypothetical protein
MSRINDALATQEARQAFEDPMNLNGHSRVAKSRQPQSRRPSDLTRSAPASPHFCLPYTAARSGTHDPTAPPATKRKSGDRTGDCGSPITRRS